MAVTEQNPRNISTAAAGATVFPYDFKILDKADLLVQIDGVVKVVDVDFTITGVGLDGGGSFTLVSPLVGGETVMRKRNMRLERLNDWQSLGDLRSQTLNNDQDAPVMMLQQVAEEVGRSLRLGQGVAGVSTELGNPVPLAPLVWNADGTQLVAGSPLGTGDMLLRSELANTTAGKGGFLVRFIQAGVGAVARWSTDKLRERVSVKDFGAVGDGWADDGPAFQKAVNYALTLINGCRVYVPAGKYRIGTQVSIPIAGNTGKVIYGDGVGSIISVGSVAGGAHGIYVGAASASGLANTVFENLMFEGNGTGGKGVRLENANTCRFVGCTFAYMGTGVEMTESYSVRFSGCSFKSVASYGVISTTGAHHTTFNNCNFYDSGLNVSFGTCVQFGAASDNIVFRDCDFEGNRRVLVCYGGSSFVFDGCYIENGVGSLLDVAGAIKINGLSIRNCWISNNAPFQLNMIDGGELTLNKINAQTITFNASTVSHFDVGNNYLVTSTVAAAPFIAVTSFSNGYTGINVGYKRHNDGSVSLQGTLTLGANNTMAFQLPAGFRPLQTLYQPVNSTTMALGGVTIDANNGNVVPNTAGANIVLNGIRFQAS